MNRFLSMLSAALLIATVAACGGNTDDAPMHDNDAMAEHAGDHAMGEHADEMTAHHAAGHGVMMQDGVQVAEITAGATGYSPEQIELEAGVPARLIFTRTTPSACLEQVMIPEFGIEATDLPMHEPVVIEFTPDEAGSFSFVCGMDMQHGTMVVRS